MPNNANSHTDKTFAQLIDSFSPFIHSRAAQLSSRPLEAEDLVQEGLIGLAAAINSFNAEKGISFNTYAHTCINNSILSAVRAASRMKHSPLNSSLPLSDLSVASSVPPAPSAEEQAISNEDFCVLKNKIDNSLSDFEKRVLESRVNGRSNIETASALGVSIKSVSNAVERARRKLKEYMPK